MSFEIFVNYLLKTSIQDWDDHWIPQFTHCRPDLINYDFMLRVDHLQDDFLQYFGIILEAEDSVSESLISEYLAQLNNQTVDQLMKTYKRDFQVYYQLS